MARFTFVLAKNQLGKQALDFRHNSVIQMGEEFDSYANHFYLRKHN